MYSQCLIWVITLHLQTICACMDLCKYVCTLSYEQATVGSYIKALVCILNNCLKF